MKKVVLIALAVIGFQFSVNAQSAASTNEVKFQTSAKCGMCKKRIERDLGLTKGVEKATLDLSDKSVTIVYNSKKTNASKLKEKISKIGYDADEVVADKKSHDALPECCQKTAAAHMD
jgi:periplasmic mercuric ion binding protein